MKFLNKLTITCLPFILLTSTSHAFYGQGETLSLFDLNDPSIVQLNATNFEEWIYDRPYLSVVLAYSLSCGHCQNYAPVFSQFAHQVRNWDSHVKLFTLRCDQNTKFCGRLGIYGGPTTTIFVPFTPKGQRGKVRPTHNEINLFEQMIIDELERLSLLASLQPRRPKDKRDLIRLMNEIDSPVKLLMVEGPDCPVAKRLVLDLLPFVRHVTVLLLEERNHQWTDELVASEETFLPFLFELQPSGKLKLISSGLTRAKFKSLIFNQYLQDVIDQQQLPLPASSSSSTVGDPTNGGSTQEADNGFPHQVYTRDLNNALRYAFYHEIVRYPSLDGNQIKALAAFTSILNKYFPYDNENTRRFLKRISQWTNDKRGQSNLTVTSVKAIFRAGSEGFLPTPQPYLSCRGSQEGYRGYPCSLWLLFHVLTVQEFRHNRLQVPTDRAEHRVLFAMRDYMRNFFSCAECADHFVEASRDLDRKLVYPNSSVIWLWDMHNQVNLRLRGRASEDPVYPKQIFPPTRLCRDCRHNDHSAGGDDETPVWDYVRVQEFLVAHYGRPGLKKVPAGTTPAMLTSSSFQLNTKMSHVHNAVLAISFVIWKLLQWSGGYDQVLVHLVNKMFH